jgi:hypothetical protein
VELCFDNRCRFGNRVGYSGLIYDEDVAGCAPHWKLRVSIFSGNDMVEITVTAHPADRFQYMSRLRRVEGGS